MIAPESRFALAAGIPIAVWLLASVGCQPGEARRPAEPVRGQAEGAEAPRVLDVDDAEQHASMPDPNALFEGWEQPEFVLLLTGQQHGYVEPCGCTEFALQKGGLARRHSLARELANRGWTVVPVDAGNQVRRIGQQAEIKFQMTLDAMKTMGYQAITFGRDDLHLSPGVLVAATARTEEQDSPFVCANVAILLRTWTPTHRVLRAGDSKIGVTAVVGDSWLAELRGAEEEIIRAPAAEALGEVVAELEAADCDLHVLLAHATLDESKRLAEQFPQFDIVVSAGGAGDPLYQPQRVGEALLVQVGVKGMYAGVVGLFKEGERLRYQRVPLDARFEDSPAMLQLMASYQKQLEATGLQGLGIKPLTHPTGNVFVGSRTCGECHTAEFEIWESTPHAHATDSLVDPYARSQDIPIPRHHDPECLSCHVTGWSPDRYFPYTSGYLGLEETPLMHGSGCENCHGPGSAHVAAEFAGLALSERDGKPHAAQIAGDLGAAEVTDEIRQKHRSAMRLPLLRAEDHCIKCHDVDNSPEFDFKAYWPQIEH